MADVVLINPANVEDPFGSAKEIPPLGLLSLAAVLEQDGYNVRVIDLEFAQDNVARILEEESPTVVGIGGTSVSRFSAFEIAKIAKLVNPKITVVYGGSHASFAAEDTLIRIPQIDVIVHGEGELVIRELIACLRYQDSLSKVRGISYRNNGRVVSNAPMPRIRDLDSLPMPARHLVDMRRYTLKLDLIGQKAASLVTSRGCPINCSFCSASVMFGRMLTTRSARNIVDEIAYVLDNYGVKGIKFFDSTFTLSRKHVESICDEIIRRGISFPWECEIRVDTVDLPLLQKMKSAGCYMVDFGVESASPQVLHRMHKRITLAQVEDVLKWTNDLGIAQKVFFTFGHINETMEDAEQTLSFIERNLNRISRPSINVGIRIYPGTEVEKYAFTQGYLGIFSWAEPYEAKENLILNAPRNIPLLLQPQMGLQELLEIKRRTLALQGSNLKFVLRRLAGAHSLSDLLRYARGVGKVTRLTLQHRLSNRD